MTGYCATGIQRGEQPVIVKCFVCQQNAKGHAMEQALNTPLVAHRRKGRSWLFHVPPARGVSRQGAPVPTLRKTASRNRRLSRAVTA